jgi:hypothetical protein
MAYVRVSDKHGRLIDREQYVDAVTGLLVVPLHLMRIPQYPPGKSFGDAVLLGVVAVGQSAEDTMQSVLELELSYVRDKSAAPLDPHQFIFLARPA